jgi:regulator of PEP synthase PpsR (kinase-PPPase family)
MNVGVDHNLQRVQMLNKTKLGGQPYTTFIRAVASFIQNRCHCNFYMCCSITWHFIDPLKSELATPSEAYSCYLLPSDTVSVPYPGTK